MPDQDAHETLARHVARQALTTIAPDQLRSFDERADDYFADPDSASPTAGRANEPVGMGFETVAAMTVVLLYIADKVMEHLLGEVIRKASSKAKARFPFARRAQPAPELTALPELSPEQIQTVRALATREAAAWGLSPSRAAELADAVTQAVTDQAQAPA